MRFSLALAGALLLCGPAAAQDVTLAPSADVRLRYEGVDQDGLDARADAITLRVRPGLTAAAGGWSALVEGEAAFVLAGNYNSGTNGKAAYPLIVDPGNVELNRAQLRYAGADGFAATAGRQRLEIGDQRFVGSGTFRQNEQTFDAVRAQWGGAQGLSADLTYAWSNRTVNGRRGTGVRQEAVEGDNVFTMLAYGTRAGTLTGFAYLVDQDEAAVQGYRLSSQTYGVRLAGAVALNARTRLSYAASWARQSDYHRNPNDYAADYWLGEATLATAGWTAAIGYEVLGADKGLALTSVQTPLAALFKFNGWADKFTTTPPDGLRDLYGTLGHGWKKTGPADAITLAATWHRFTSDRLLRRYGDELNLLASIRRGRATLSARYAHYAAKRFATDTDKLWLSLDWSL
jgi:hypothetical protein